MHQVAEEGDVCAFFFYILGNQCHLSYQLGSGGVSFSLDR